MRISLVTAVMPQNTFYECFGSIFFNFILCVVFWNHNNIKTRHHIKTGSKIYLVLIALLRIFFTAARIQFFIIFQKIVLSKKNTLIFPFESQTNSLSVFFRPNQCFYHPKLLVTVNHIEWTPPFSSYCVISVRVIIAVSDQTYLLHLMCLFHFVLSRKISVSLSLFIQNPYFSPLYTLIFFHLSFHLPLNIFTQ